MPTSALVGIALRGTKQTKVFWFFFSKKEHVFLFIRLPQGARRAAFLM
jgi:hypothetical protein